MHHATRKAAVEKYGPLHKEGKSEADVKAAIAADEKQFDEAGVLEVFTAIQEDEAYKSEKGPDEQNPDAGDGAKGNDPNANSNAGDKDGKKGEDNGSDQPEKYTVEVEFRDIANFNKVHSVGDDVSHFAKDRLEHLVNTGVVKKS